MYRPEFSASTNYNIGKSDAMNSLFVMSKAMQDMGTEHVNFHEHFTDVQKRLEDMKKRYGTNELDVEVIRATALDKYLSDGNLPKVMALGHLELEKALKDFRNGEEKLSNLQKETARLLERLLGGAAASHK